MSKPHFGNASVGIVTPEILHFDQPIRLECGRQLNQFDLAVETYGTLNADRSNAVLVCHALTGDQHFAHTHPVTGKPGWWERLVGPGKPVDTDRYFVICSNVVGSCMGSTGPASIDPATGQVLAAKDTIVPMVPGSVVPCSRYSVSCPFR